MTASMNEALRQLADAATLVASATAALAQPDLPAGHAAYFAMLTEHLGQQLTRAQIYAAEAARRTGAHKLDQESLQAISDAGPNPSAQDLAATTGRTTSARTHFKHTADFLHGWLRIPLSTARERLLQADCLVAGVNDAGQVTGPWLPALAQEFSDVNTDPRLVVAASKKIHAVRNDLGQDHERDAAKTKLQSEAVHFIKNEPETARKHLSDLVAEVKSGTREMKALLAEIGFFKVGIRNGLVEYVLRVLPSQASVIEAFRQQLNNPKTIAGNRDALRELDSELTGEPTSQWDDDHTMPDWARTEATPIDQPTPTDQPSPQSNNKSTAEPAEDTGAPEQIEAPWENLSPERRHLIGFMALLMSDRTGSGGSPGKQPGLVTPQVSIIMDYEKMLERGKDFAVTSSGFALTVGETRAALCNAGVYPLVLNGKSLPLDLGRTQRLYTKAQGRAIRAAYRGCSYPGCSMPAERCELDHLDAWEKGGNTDICSADLGCPVHHIERHCGLFHAVKIPGCRPMVLLSKELDPQQRLRVNTFFLSPNEALEANHLADSMTRLWRAGKLDVEIVDP
ncbi:HNH endonuclease signature motif containing protein [Arthrobacter sp. MYb213]|uniref:HNH endonuclease signature motif containing protein n=1 Tax=Arthrobacter sp. MYb213 TaxID=1848595 RepID=UPI000CFDB3EB|nr:HNH endonuclease signature motif containing protein [Arthrobacter sp. MYb213]PRB68666.1 HNH endonuclease [Arthrobacter sp. MYb213]